MDSAINGMAGCTFNILQLRIKIQDIKSKCASLNTNIRSIARNTNDIIEITYNYFLMINYTDLIISQLLLKSPVKKDEFPIIIQRA